MQWLVPILIALFLYKKFFRNTAFSISHFSEQLQQLPLQWYLLIALCAFVNWTLETLKWQYLIKDVNPLSFKKALRSVLSGVAISQLLPYKTGEYLGRLMYVHNHHKLNAGLLSIVGGYSQLLMTFFFGIIGFSVIQPIAYSNFLIVSFVLILIVALILYWYIPKANFYWVDKGWMLKITLKLKAAAALLNRKQLLNILGLSAFRYFFFLMPYSLLAWHFNLGMQATLFYHLMAVSCIFLMQSIAPNFILTDVAIRIAIPVMVFSKGVVQGSQMDYVPGMIIYLFNVALPMLIGACLIMFVKFKEG